MTDIEHAKKYAEESISLATSMYNPRAEKIAELACLYGLTYKNEQLNKAIKHLKDLAYVVELGKNELATARILAEAKKFLNEVEK